MAGVNEDLGAGGVPPTPPNAEEVPEEEVVAQPADPEDDHLLDQQPGPANQNQPRPSSVIPGIREGSALYTDGNGYYYYAEKVLGNRRCLKCSEKNRRKCLARATMGLEEGAPILPTFNSPSHNHQPNASKGKKLILMARLKERAQQETEPRIHEILNEEVVRDPEASFHITHEQAKRAMKRVRRATKPAIPRTHLDRREEILRPGRIASRLRTYEKTDSSTHQGEQKDVAATSNDFEYSRIGSFSSIIQIPPQPSKGRIISQAPRQNERVEKAWAVLDAPIKSSIVSVWEEKLSKLERNQRLFAEKAINEIILEAELGTLSREFLMQLSNIANKNHTCTSSSITNSHTSPAQNSTKQVEIIEEIDITDDTEDWPTTANRTPTNDSRFIFKLFRNE